MKTRKTDSRIEHRVMPAELRTDGESKKIVGHAAVFESPSYSGRTFVEKIDRDAFTESIKTDDVRALINHDPNYVLGRNTAGTLDLSVDEHGLRYSIDPPDTQYARDLQVSIDRGDISQSSFGFEVIDQEWVEKKDELPMRIIRKAKLWDVSPVTFPFYEDTDVALRSLEEHRKTAEPPTPYQTNQLRKRQSLKGKLGGH